jgi:hypothetical protein
MFVSSPAQFKFDRPVPAQPDSNLITRRSGLIQIRWACLKMPDLYLICRRPAQPIFCLARVRLEQEPEPIKITIMRITTKLEFFYVL